MRIAPVGLVVNPNLAFELGCEAAAITHGHPSGYLTAGFQASVIRSIIEAHSLSDSIDAAMEELQKHPGHEETRDAVERAVSFGRDPVFHSPMKCWSPAPLQAPRGSATSPPRPSGGRAG
jgi:ADP-ribosylglycohydrolase